MASNDLKLQLVIQAILDAKGFDEAKASLTGLAATANNAAPSMKVLANETENVAIQQEVSSREIKILTREMLQSIGASEGAGSAGRLAAVAFSAMGNAAQFANLAITTVGFGLAFLLPRLLEFLTTTDDSAKAQEELRKSIISSIPELERYVALMGQEAALASKELEAAKILALADQHRLLLKTIDDLIAARNKEEAQRLSGDKGRAETIALIEGLESKEQQLMQADRDKVVLEDERHRQIKARLADEKDLDDFEKQQADKSKARKEKISHDEDEQWKHTIEVANAAANARAHIQERDDKLDKEAVLAHAQRISREVLADEVASAEEIRLSKERIRKADAERAAKEEATNAEISYIGQTASALAEVFGHNKALAIAGAIADTWAGATKALATVPWPANIAAAASVAAAGLANVVNIEKASPGFDDPMNDIIAERLGRKSASDFVRLFGGGFHDGLRAANTGGGSVVNTTINRGVSVQSLHMSGILGVNEQDVMKNLNRKLISAQRLEARTTLGRS